MSVKSIKRPATSGILLAASAAVALAAFDESPAYANDAFLRGFVGGMVGGMVGNMLMQQRFHGGGGYGHRPAPARSGGAAYSHSRPTGNGAPPSPEESSRALASLAHRAADHSGRAGDPEIRDARPIARGRWRVG